MPDLLESGKLQLSPKDAVSYRAAAERLHDACEIALDLAQPISVTELLLLQVAKAGIAGDTTAIDSVIAKVEEGIRQKAGPR